MGSAHLQNRPGSDCGCRMVDSLPPLGPKVLKRPVMLLNLTGSIRGTSPRSSTEMAPVCLKLAGNCNERAHHGQEAIPLAKAASLRGGRIPRLIATCDTWVLEGPR
jgi:hypothetical protein